jgi:P4 family phage/plasmid primase-like protien
MQKSIEELLRNHYVDAGGVFHTHVSMINPVGRFIFNRHDIETLWDSYCDKIKNEEDPIFGIAEISQQYLPVLIDADIKLKDDDTITYGEHLYTEDNVLSIIQICQSVLRDIVEDCNDKHLTCVLLEKPIYYMESGTTTYIKNGFHLHFPYIILNKNDQQIHFLPRILELINEYDVFSNLGIKDSSSVIDKQCCSVPWLLYGSRKQEDMDPYKVTTIYNSQCEKISLEEAFKNYKIFDSNERPIKIRNKVQYYLPRILSIIPYGRENMELKNNLLIPGSENKPKPTRVQVEKSERKVYDKNYDKDMELASKLISLLSTQRSDDRDTWINVGLALYNVSEGSSDGLELFHEFSSKSDKYDESGCDSTWNGFTYREDGLTLGSLRYWAQCDNPEQYKELVDGINSSKIEYLILEILGGSHSNIADFFKHVYGDDNIRVLNQEPSKMKFAHWNDDKKLWTIEKKIVLSRLLSTVVKPYVDEYSKKIQNQMATADEVDQDSFKSRLKLIHKLSTNLCSTPFLNNVITFYCSYQIDDSFEGRLNSKSNELPIKGGKIIDMKTKVVRDRTRDDLFSFELEVDYINACDYSNVIRFFSDICNGNQDLVDYHKRFWGYSMTGEISDRSLHILYGVGRNGKSTLIDIFQKVLGNKYFVSCSDKVIMNKDNSSSTSPELVRLMGARFAVLSETGKEEELNATRIKSITGGDNIVARGLYQDEVQFKLQSTLAMLTNNKPIFDVKDQAMLDRIKLIPFLARFDNTPENREYINELMNNCLDEFFSWFVDGAFEWYGGKQLVPCQVMSHEMKAYINELDIQGQFIEERIEVITKQDYESTPKLQKSTQRIKKDALYGMFMAYTMEQGIRVKMSKSDFHKSMSKYNIEMITCKGFPYYICKEKEVTVENDDNE